MSKKIDVAKLQSAFDALLFNAMLKCQSPLKIEMSDHSGHFYLYDAHGSEIAGSDDKEVLEFIIAAAVKQKEDLDRMERATEAVSFTGHRPEKLGGYGENPTKDKVVAFLKKTVKQLSDDGYTEFISGGALGVDQWAAQVVLDLGLKLTLALPYEKYGENWPAESQQYLAELRAKANKVHIVCDGDYASWKNHVRNEWMGDNAEICVAVYDGDEEGGTASAVRYNKKIGRHFIRYNPKTDAVEPV